MWWILYLYLALVAISGRSIFFFDQRLVKAVSEKIALAKGNTPLRPRKELTKWQLIPLALLAAPVIGVLTSVALLAVTLYTAYLLVDLVLYILILAPFGFKRWRPGFIKLPKINRGSELPWYFALFARTEDFQSMSHHTYYNKRHLGPFKDPEQALSKLRGFYKEHRNFDNPKKYPAGFTIITPSWSLIAYPPSQDSHKIFVCVASTSYDNRKEIEAEIDKLLGQ